MPVADPVIKIEDTESERDTPHLQPVAPQVGVEATDQFGGEADWEEGHQALPSELVETTREPWNFEDMEFDAIDDPTLLSDLRVSADHVEAPSSTSGDDSDSDSSVDEEDMARKHGNLSTFWDDIGEPCYQQKKSKGLHLPGSSQGTLKCGRRVIVGYSYLPDGASFQWARCSVCFKGQVITNAGDMADAMDAIRRRRFQS